MNGPATSSSTPLAKENALTWEEVEAHINERTQAIWLNEPIDLERVRNGAIDSGAGSYGQVFTTLLFGQSELRGLAFYATTAVLKLANDNSFTLDHLKKMAHAHFAYRAGFLNYVGLHEFGDLFLRYFAVLDQLPTREAFIRLTQAIHTYGARLHLWAEHVFPWHLGMHMHQRDKNEVQALLEHASREPWVRVSYQTK
jgi:hypothetical protein